MFADRIGDLHATNGLLELLHGGGSPAELLHQGLAPAADAAKQNKKSQKAPFLIFNCMPAGGRLYTYDLTDKRDIEPRDTAAERVTR